MLRYLSQISCNKTQLPLVLPKLVKYLFQASRIFNSLHFKQKQELALSRDMKLAKNMSQRVYLKFPWEFTMRIVSVRLGVNSHAGFSLVLSTSILIKFMLLMVKIQQLSDSR